MDEIIQRVRAMPAVEFREAVAERVMGWRRPRVGIANRPPFPAHGRYWDDNDPPEDVENWRSDFFWCAPDGSRWDEPPDPASNTRSCDGDYQVLKYVRDNWAFAFREEGKAYRFMEVLRSIWRERCPGDGVVFSTIAYEPGDYATAALCVVEDIVEAAESRKE